MKRIALICALFALMAPQTLSSAGVRYTPAGFSELRTIIARTTQPIVFLHDVGKASTPENSRYVGDPVDVVKGEVRSFPQVDFTLFGSYQPFVFSRTYHSSKKEDGPFGYGWTHSYDITLTKRSDEWFEIVTEKGELLVFIFRLEKKEFLPFMWNKSSLTRQLTNPGAAHPLYRMVWQTKYGVKYIFPDVFWKKPHVRYRICAIEYPDGSAVRFTPDDGSLPTQVIDPHGRVIRLSYSNGRITKVFEPGRPADEPISYGYDDQGNLTSVKYPVDADTTYTRRYYYTDPHNAHNLTQIMDEHGFSFHYDYDQSGRCLVSQGDDFGAGPYFKHTFAYNPDERKTVVKRWRGSDIFTEIFSYSKNNDITKIEYTDSGETTEYDYDLHMNGESTLEISESNAAKKEAFKKSVRFDDKFKVKEISVGTTKSKAEKPETLRIKVFYEDTKSPATPTKIVDQHDNLLDIPPESFNKIEEIFHVKEAEELGQPPNVEAFLAKNNDSFSVNKSKPVRNEQGLIREMVIDDGSTCEYSYDGAGRCVRLVIQRGKSRREIQITYDWLGRMNLVTRMEESGEIRNESYTYDASDMFDKAASYAINKTGFDGLKTQFLYNGAGLLWKIVRFKTSDPSVTTYEYDAFGNLVRVVLPDDSEIRANYDTRDRLVNIYAPRRLLEL